MAYAGKKFGKDLEFSIDTAGTSSASTEVSISDWVQSVDGLPGEREMADVTCGGGAVAHQYLLGLQNAEITVTCLFDQTSGSAYDTLSGYMNDTHSRTFTYQPAGASTDFPKITGECRLKSMVFSAKPLEPLTFTMNMVLDSTMTVTTTT